MSKNLQITNDSIIYKRRKVGEISSSAITAGFQINFDDIQIITISPRLAFDDEMLMVTIINRNQTFYQFSSAEFGGEALTQIELRLGLKSICMTEWEKFSWKEHENYITDKIIYPKKLYWEDLFIPPKHLEKRMIQVLKFFEIKKSVSGDFNPRVVNYLNKASIAQKDSR